MVTSIDALADAVVAHLDALPTLPGVVTLGEPTHGEPAFVDLWAAVLDRLVDRGVRSVALETDAVAAVAVDTWVRGGPGPLDDVLATGFTHGFGARGGMRELLARLRVRNDELPVGERVAVHGFDLPTETTGAPTPRPHLEHLHRYLLGALGAAAVPVDATDLDDLLGPDAPWGTWEAQLDAARSVGGSPAAITLRAVADDLVTALHARAPFLMAATSPAAWRTAERHGRTALGLLRYHAAAARAVPQEDRFSALSTARDTEMARHLLAIRRHERDRGPTLVLAHNGHLQRARATWTLGGADAAWVSAGSIVAALAEDTSVHVAGALAASATLDLPTPPAGTIEGDLLARCDGSGLVAAADVAELVDGSGSTARGDVRVEQGYVPLSVEAVRGADAVVLLDLSDGHDDGPAGDPSVTDLVARLLARPGVTHLRAGEDAPPSARGDWFLYAGPDDRMPFATVVVSDYPGYDEASRLDRPGVFRLNLGVGRSVAADVVDDGAAPDDLDRVVSHPLYAAQGWVAILNPSAARLPAIDRLVEGALAGARRGRDAVRP